MATQVQITVPPGMGAGQEVQFRTPAGAMMNVRIPVGVPPGHAFVVNIPAPVSVPMGAPVPMGSPVPMTTSPSEPWVNNQPSWADARQLGVAQRYAECAISFEPLHAGKVGAFLDSRGERVSNHYFSLPHAREWLASGTGTCPLTRRPIAGVVELPDVLTDPDGWFKCVDIDGNGKLSRAEAIEAIKASFPVDVAKLDETISDENHWLWQQWDVDKSGYLERNELLAPQGLVPSVREMFAVGGRGADDVPDMRRDKGAWYDYWDEDKSGCLEQDEVVRALLKTLRITADPARVQEMRSTVTAIWPIFDPDGSNSIDRREFLMPDGLADTILATMP